MDHELMRRLHGRKDGAFEKVSFRIPLTSRLEVARDTWLFRFEKPEGFRYRAGQHVRMSLLNFKSENPPGNHRFWSFASAPHEPDLAFAIRMRSSPFKRELMSLPIGASVQIAMLKNPPHGAFALDDGDSPVVFLTGGIGVVPAYSMIREALSQPGSRQMTLFYSARSIADAPFFRELQILAAQDSRFTFVPTLTADTRATDWQGETGRISLDVIHRHVPGLATAQIYISGLKGMVEDLKAVLTRSGIAASAIRTEEFGTFSLTHTRGRSPIKTLPVLGLAMAALIILAAHIGPAWLLTHSHPLLWLKTHPLSSGAVAILLLLLVGKVTAFLHLRRRGTFLH